MKDERNLEGKKRKTKKKPDVMVFPSVFRLSFFRSSSDFFASMDVHTSLRLAICGNKVAEVKAILKDNPGLDLHTKVDKVGHFHLAIALRRPEIVKLFMNYPGVDLNKKDKGGITILSRAIVGRDVEVLKLLLRDKRAKYLRNDPEWWSPLNFACDFGELENVQWVLYLRGREIDDTEVRDLITVATEKNHSEIVNLLKRFKLNREHTIFQLEWELEPPGNLALLFAALVFLEVGLLRLKVKSKKQNDKRRLRFFRMALQLPTELQMPLCYRVYELSEEYIPNKVALAGFKKLAADLSSSS